MSVINPPSGIVTNKLLPANSTNFPALKLFCPCYQSEIGLTYLTDIINGVQLTKTSGTVAAPAAPDGYSLFPSQNAGTITGTFPVIGAKNCILFGVGKFNAGGALLGKTSAALGGISIAQAQTTALFDGTNTLDNSINGAFTNSSSIYGRALSVNWSGNATSYEVVLAGASVTTKTGTATSTASPGTIAGGIATIEPAWTVSSAVTNLYGLGLLVFNGSLPTDIPAMLAWMTYHLSHQDAKKTFYPAWKGVS